MLVLNVIYRAVAESHRMCVAQCTSGFRKGVGIIGGFGYLRIHSTRGTISGSALTNPTERYCLSLRRPQRQIPCKKTEHG